MRGLSDRAAAELARRARRGDKGASERLVQSYLSMARSFVRKYRIPAQDRDDMLQVGITGILMAIRAHRSARGSFRSVVYLHIRRAIVDSMRANGVSLIRVNRSQLARGDTPEVSSIDAEPRGDEDGIRLRDVLAATADESVDLADEAEAALGRLGRREERAMRLFYGIGCSPCTMAEIGRELRISEGRVCQILAGARTRARG